MRVVGDPRHAVRPRGSTDPIRLQLARAQCRFLAERAKQELLRLPRAKPVRIAIGCGGAGHRVSMPDGQSALTCPAQSAPRSPMNLLAGGSDQWGKVADPSRETAMKKLIALAFLALAIAGVGMMTHTASTAEAYAQLKA